MGRAINQQELVRLIEAETGGKLSQSYLSQIESGARPHLTHTSQQLLAKFFRVYPGFLVDDPPGYARELQSELRVADARVDSWLYGGVGHFTTDPELQRALMMIADHPDSRQALLLLAEILRAPGLEERLSEVLRPRSREGRSAPSSAQREDQAAARREPRGFLGT